MTFELKKLQEYNAKFVKNQDNLPFLTTKYPNQETLILTCMDTRLIELLPQALNFKNGDVKIIKNAGGIITHPYGSVMRSIVIAIYELKVKNILVIGHHDCGVKNLDGQKILTKIQADGIDYLSLQKQLNFDLANWLSGFNNEEEAVLETINTIKNHPLLIKTSINIYGLIISPITGELTYLDC